MLVTKDTAHCTPLLVLRLFIKRTRLPNLLVGFWIRPHPESRAQGPFLTSDCNLGSSGHPTDCGRDSSPPLPFHTHPAAQPAAGMGSPGLRHRALPYLPPICTEQGAPASADPGCCTHPGSRGHGPGEASPRPGARAGRVAAAGDPAGCLQSMSVGGRGGGHWQDQASF